MVNQGIQHQIGIAIIKIFPLAFTSERSELIQCDVLRKKKLGSGYSKIFQLTILVPKLDFGDLKLKIDEEYLIYRS